MADSGRCSLSPKSGKRDFSLTSFAKSRPSKRGKPCFYRRMLNANGADMKTIQSLMRHANVSVTMDTYVQAVTPVKREAQRAIVGLLDPNGPTMLK